MKHLRPTQLLPWLLAALCPPVLTGCGRALQHEAELDSQNPGSSADSSSALQGLASHRNADVSSSASATSNPDAGSSAHADGELAKASCDSLEQTLRQEVATEYAAASTACQVDSDCTTGGDVGCYYSCGGPIVSIDGREAAQRALLESIVPVCGELTQRCPGRGPPGCPPIPTTIACNDGTCGLLSCEGLPERLAQDIDRIAQNLPHQCTSDEDCVVISTSVPCIPDCGRYRSVRVGYDIELNERVQSAGNTVCWELESRQCPPIPAPSCPALTAQPSAACVAGQCAFASAH